VKFGKIFIGLSVVLLAVALIKADDPIDPFPQTWCVEPDDPSVVPCAPEIIFNCYCNHCWSAYCEGESKFKIACECTGGTGLVCDNKPNYKPSLAGHDARNITFDCCFEYSCIPSTAPPGGNPALCDFDCDGVTFAYSCDTQIGADVPYTVLLRYLPLRTCYLVEP
jgi:hypothetical protein